MGGANKIMSDLKREKKLKVTIAFRLDKCCMIPVHVAIQWIMCFPRTY